MVEKEVGEDELKVVTEVTRLSDDVVGVLLVMVIGEELCPLVFSTGFVDPDGKLEPPDVGPDGPCEGTIELPVVVRPVPVLLVTVPVPLLPVIGVTLLKEEVSVVTGEIPSDEAETV